MSHNVWGRVIFLIHFVLSLSIYSQFKGLLSPTSVWLRDYTSTEDGEKTKIRAQISLSSWQSSKITQRANSPWPWRYNITIKNNNNSNITMTVATKLIKWCQPDCLTPSIKLLFVSQNKRTAWNLRELLSDSSTRNLHVLSKMGSHQSPNIKQSMSNLAAASVRKFPLGYLVNFVWTFQTNPFLVPVSIFIVMSMSSLARWIF